MNEVISYRYHPCQLWARYRFLADSPVSARCRPSLENESVSVGGVTVKTEWANQLWTMCSKSTNWHAPHGAAAVHPDRYQEGWRSPLGWGWAPWPALPGHLAPSVGSPSDPLAAQAASQPDTHPLTKTWGSLQKNTALWSQSICHRAPRHWNNLPRSIRMTRW